MVVMESLTLRQSATFRLTPPLLCRRQSWQVEIKESAILKMIRANPHLTAFDALHTIEPLGLHVLLSWHYLNEGSQQWIMKDPVSYSRKDYSKEEKHALDLYITEILINIDNFIPLGIPDDCVNSVLIFLFESGFIMFPEDYYYEHWWNSTIEPLEAFVTERGFNWIRGDEMLKAVFLEGD